MNLGRGCSKVICLGLADKRLHNSGGLVSEAAKWKAAFLVIGGRFPKGGRILCFFRGAPRGSVKLPVTAPGESGAPFTSNMSVAPLFLNQ
jgi:hypothetical protein